MEARIRQLTALLERATVGEAPPDDGIAEPGMIVTIELFGEDETFLMGSREIGEHTDLPVYSEKSAMGAAINGRRVGEEVTYNAPNGKQITVKIKGARPYDG